MNNATMAQNVSIPDANFKAELVENSSINTNGDDEIQVSEAQAFTESISVTAKSISDLTSIAAFVNLTELVCPSNSLTSLDISANTALEELNCQQNNLTSLDISAHKNLIHLTCKKNQLTSLNVANGNNSNFTFFHAADNPLLTCITVDNGFDADAAGWIKDATASWNNSGTPCGGTISVTGVTVSPTTATITAGNTQVLTATVLPTDATDKTLTWSSNNTAVATVDAAGVVTAVAADTATITVTTNDGGFTATCAVTVVAPQFSIDISNHDYGIIDLAATAT